MTRQTFLGIRKIGSRAGVVVGIVAGKTREPFAVPKAAARQQSDRREPNRHRIFEFGFVTHIRPGQTVALAADLNLGFRGKAPRIHDFSSNGFARGALLCGLNVGASRSVATLALNTGRQVGQVGSGGPLLRAGGMTIEAPEDGSIVLQHSEFRQRRADVRGMAESGGEIPEARIVGKAVLEVLGADTAHGSAALDAGSEGPFDDGGGAARP